MVRFLATAIGLQKKKRQIGGKRLSVKGALFQVVAMFKWFCVCKFQQLATGAILFCTNDALFVLFWYPNSWSVYSNTIWYSFPSVNRVIDSTASESPSPWCALPACAGCVIIVVIIIKLSLCLANHAIDDNAVACACELARAKGDQRQ